MVDLMLEGQGLKALGDQADRLSSRIQPVNPDLLCPTHIPGIVRDAQAPFSEDSHSFVPVNFGIDQYDPSVMFFFGLSRDVADDDSVSLADLRGGQGHAGRCGECIEKVLDNSIRRIIQGLNLPGTGF